MGSLQPNVQTLGTHNIVFVLGRGVLGTDCDGSYSGNCCCPCCGLAGSFVEVVTFGSLFAVDLVGQIRWLNFVGVGYHFQFLFFVGGMGRSVLCGCASRLGVDHIVCPVGFCWSCFAIYCVLMILGGLHCLGFPP